MIGDDVPAWMQQFLGADAATLIARDSLAMLRGSAQEMADELQRRRMHLALPMSPSTPSSSSSSPRSSNCSRATDRPVPPGSCQWVWILVARLDLLAAPRRGIEWLAMAVRA